MNAIPPPPIPLGLQELLKDHPGHLRILQEDLNRVVANPFGITPVFEQALWALEDALGAFIQEVRAELKEAEASGDASAIEAAKRELRTMLDARPSVAWKPQELMDYFDMHEANRVR